jgi:hypothetical protein
MVNKPKTIMRIIILGKWKMFSKKLDLVRAAASMFNHGKYLLAFVLICVTIESNCQIDKPIKKGNIVLGGGTSFSYSQISGKYRSYDLNQGQYYDVTIDQKNISFSLWPSFGYFITDGLVIGMSPSYSFSQQKYSSFTWKTNSVGIAPFIKYYTNSGFFLFMESGFHYSISKQQGFDNERKNNWFSISPGVGYAFFINPKVSIEPSLEYTFNKSIDKDNADINTDTKSHYISLNIGFQIFL